MNAPLLLAAEMGRIQGGWGFVWTAYGLTWASVVAYALSLWLRHPRKGG
jgi:heme exporter protein D